MPFGENLPNDAIINRISPSRESRQGRPNGAYLTCWLPLRESRQTKKDEDDVFTKPLVCRHPIKKPWNKSDGVPTPK
jgi:hypothetical protein